MNKIQKETKQILEQAQREVDSMPDWVRNSDGIRKASDEYNK